jgi:UDP-N-acetylmuramate dehydrogenase
MTQDEFESGAPHASRLTPHPLRGELHRHEPMAKHVSWRAGGAVDRAYRPADLDDLRTFLRSLAPEEPVYFVGLGSNLLVRDGGLRGTVVFTHWALRDLALGASTADEGEVSVGAGVASPKVARFAAMHDLVGAEFLAGIPGTMGGALAMNAGCYGGETWNVVRKVVTLDHAGELHERTPVQYRIGYRTVVKRCNQIASVSPAAAVRRRSGIDEWFVSAVLALPRGDGTESRAKVKDLLSRRIASQPLGQPNAGSVFRNPPGTYAAKLIEDCGLKGRVIGGAVISPKHANFIVNTGTARAADIESLIELAQNTVKEKFGIELEREVRIVGERATPASDGGERMRDERKGRTHKGLDGGLV